MNNLTVQSRISPKQVHRPRFRGSWEIHPSVSNNFLFNLGLLPRDPIIPKQCLQTARAVEAAFEANQNEIDALPQSVQLTYVPVFYENMGLKHPSYSYILEGRGTYSWTDTIHIELTPGEPRPNPKPSFLSRLADLFDPQPADGPVRKTVNRKWFNGWLFWEPEPVEKFVKRAIDKSRKLAEKYQAQ